MKRISRLLAAVAHYIRLAVVSVAYAIKDKQGRKQ